MKLSSNELSAILSSRGETDPTEGPALCSVAYVLALEGAATPDPQWTFWETALDAVVQGAQPPPSITHIELCLAPNARHDEMHFATYIGKKSGWGSSFGGQRSFYLGYNSSSWRAVPLVTRNASTRLRHECANHVGTPYSLAKYMFALPPFRALAFLFSDSAQAPAHCANLSARCINTAVPELKLSHSSNWYGPSTLFLELDSESRRAAFHADLSARDCRVRSIVDAESEARAIDCLLRGSDDAILALAPDACFSAIHRLTIRSLNAGLDDVAKRIVQKQLATTLIRYSVVKNS